MTSINPAMVTYNLGVFIAVGQRIEGKAVILLLECKEFVGAGCVDLILARVGVGRSHDVCVCGVDIPRMG